jgi:hypothetical protein
MDYIERLYQEFCQRRSYVTVSKDVVAQFVKEMGEREINDYLLDLLVDYIMSQGLEDDYVL